VLYPEGRFTVAEAVEYCGLSLATVHHAVKEDLAAGRLEEVEKLQWRGSGAAPRQFRVSDPSGHDRARDREGLAR
jgi:hypothetical protein